MKVTLTEIVDKDLELVWVPGLNELRITRSDGNYWPFQFHPDDENASKFVQFLREAPGK